MLSTKTLTRSFTLAMLLLAALSFGALAEEKPKPQTPATLAGGKVIAPAEAKTLLDGKQTLFFDMRSAVNFGKGHIPGAKALPYKENSEFVANFDESVDQFDLTQLPADKNAGMVFYSDGPTGWKSYKAAVKAIKAGYKKVMWFREGFASWQAAQYPVE
jgi:rhodanese-related sulfurtransferase